MEDEAKIVSDPLGETDQHEVYHKQSERHYRWVEPSRWSRRQMQGYKPVLRDDPEQAGGNLSAEGHRMLGRKTLMYCPKYLREAREQKAVDKDRVRRAQTKEQFHAAGDRMGVPTFEFDRVPERGGKTHDIEKPGAKGRQKNFPMGAGINKDTGELERAEPPPPTQGGGRRTMLDELGDKETEIVDLSE